MPLKITTFSICLTVVFGMTFFLSKYFFEGDQAKYISLYQEIIGIELSSVLYKSNLIIGTAEPVYPYLMYFLSNLSFDKIYINSISNTILVFLFLKLFLNRGTPIFFIFVSVITSFYFLQIMFEIERLKYGLIFFLLSLSCKNFKISLILAFLAILTHFQLVILYSILIFSKIIYPIFHKILIKKTVNRDHLNIFFAFLGFVFFGFYYLSDHLILKLNFYGYSFNIFEFAKSLLIGVFFSLFMSQRYMQTYILALIPLALFIGFLTGDRLNIFLYFLTLYYIVISMRYNLLSIFGFIGLSTLVGLRGIVNFFYSLEAGHWVYVY